MPVRPDCWRGGISRIGNLTGGSIDGELIAQRFRVLATLGRGGQGVVQRAIDTTNGRSVALKIRRVGSEADREEVLREARTLLRVRPHPHMAMVRADVFDGDRHVLVMDFIDGPNLASLLRASGPLPPERVLRWLAGVASALDALHREQPPVVHGDVKPSNIVIDGSDDNAVLVDFGLAASPLDADRRHATEGYAAPERTRGEPDPASDIYSLAATAYVLLTGALPAPGRHDALPGPARTAFARGLATQPNARPSSAAAFIEDLADAYGVVSPVALPRVTARRPLRLLAAAVAVVAVVLGAAFLRKDAPTTRTSAGPVATTSTSFVAPPVATTTVDAIRITTGPASGSPATNTVARQAEAVGHFSLLDPAGNLASYRVTDSGAAVAERSTATGSTQWTAVARIRANKVMLYRSSDGFNRVTTFGADGAASFGRTEDAQSGWSHVVGLADGLVFFYRSSDGFAATLRFGDQDRIRDGDSYLDWRVSNAGYDRVAYAGGNRVLLYTARTGNSQLVTVDDDGRVTTVASPRLPPNWTHLAATGNGFVLGIAATGAVTVMRSSTTGVTTVGSFSVPSGSWNQGAPFGRGVLIGHRESGDALVIDMANDGGVRRVMPFRVTAGALLGTLD